MFFITCTYYKVRSSESVELKKKALLTHSHPCCEPMIDSKGKFPLFLSLVLNGHENSNRMMILDHWKRNSHAGMDLVPRL